MLAILGDIHGDIATLKYSIDAAYDRGATALIQVGDFGLYNRDGIDSGFRRVCKGSPIPVYFIDGNHDDCTRWTEMTDVTQVFDDANLFYIPRGTVMQLDERRIGFLGGAASIDKNIRLQRGWHWDDREEVTQAQIDLLIKNAVGGPLDFLITHCPPSSVIHEHFDPMWKLRFGVGLDWTDPSQELIETVWKELGFPFIISGHMHMPVVGMTYQIVDINEMIFV